MPAVVSAAAGVSPEELRRRRRLLVAYGDAAAEHGELERFVAAEARPLAERDVDACRIVGDRAVPLSAEARPLDADAARTLAALGGTAGAFELVSIGKDGGVRRRATAADELSALFDVIDRVPVRRAETSRRDDRRGRSAPSVRAPRTGPIRRAESSRSPRRSIGRPARAA